LAHEHWKAFYTPEEVDEIISATSSTMIVAGHYPIHVRLYVRSLDAPTVIMSHPMLPYGLLLARLQLPFFRAGFNVAWWGQPGWYGPRHSVLDWVVGSAPTWRCRRRMRCPGERSSPGQTMDHCCAPLQAIRCACVNSTSCSWAP